MTPFIVESSATGEEVEQIIRERLIPNLADLPHSHILLSLLSLLLCIMKPDLTTEELKSGVRDVSQFMCLWLSQTESAESELVDQKQVN